MMRLSELLADLEALMPAELSADAVEITGLSADSRALQPGDAFVALSGAATHGLRFADAASAAGVSTILFEPPAPAGLPLPVNAIAVAGLRGAQGALADRFYGAPSQTMTVTGVTGTNGKTSTVQLLTQALALRGVTAGSIGTLGAGLYGQLVAGERTTPDTIAVHRLLAHLRDAGASHVAMEVSSHALDQGRVDAVAFKVAVFTNLTRDHLDYHGDMASYGAAKAKLFAWPSLQSVVINLDDAFGVALLDSIAPGVAVIAVSATGAPGARLRAREPMLDPAGLRFVLCEGAEQHDIRSPLLGRFNIDNLLAVAGSLRALGWPLAEVADILPRLSPVDGRMSRVGGGPGEPLVVVDYAHTPDALAQALASLRAHTPGRLHCVFGCGGERDRGKRPQMAAIAEAGADHVWVTDDNPRGESGDAILADIKAGFSVPASVHVERDRAKAIAMTVASAAAGDVILIAGKGHEPYQEIAGHKYDFDDLAIARAALQQHAGGMAAQEGACAR